MNENNAAQPGLTDDQIEALAKKHIAPHADRLEAIMTNPVPYQQTEQFRRVKALIRDLLSKLRAEGVQAGDEREAFEAWALTEFTHPFMVPDPLIEDPDGSGDYVNRDVQMAWAGYQQARSALASAPVAEPEDTREDFDIWCKKHGYASSGSINMLWSAWREALKHASAPVAYDPTMPPSAANFPPEWTVGAPCYAADGRTLTYSAPGMPIMVRAVDFNTLWSSCQASAPVAGEAQHPDDIAVDNFAAAMKAKLAKKRAEGRYGWQSTSHITLSALLYEHMYKGDPLDVGNLAMMLHQNGKPIELPEHARRKDAAPQASEAVADLLSDALYYLKGNLPDSAADHAHKAAVISRVESALAAHTKDSQ